MVRRRCTESRSRHSDFSSSQRSRNEPVNHTHVERQRECVCVRMWEKLLYLWLRSKWLCRSSMLTRWAQTFLVPRPHSTPASFPDLILPQPCSQASFHPSLVPRPHSTLPLFPGLIPPQPHSQASFHPSLVPRPHSTLPLFPGLIPP